MRLLESIKLLFQDFGDYAKMFFNNFITNSLWIPIFFTVILIYVLTLILSKLAPISKGTTKTFTINKALILACMITALLVIGISCFVWSYDFNGALDESFRLSLLISLIITFLCSIIAMANLKQNFVRSKSKNLITQPITQYSELNCLLLLRKAYRKIKIWLLLPLFGFIFLAFNKNESNLVSIVIDSSGSMGGGGLEQAKKSLSSTLAELNPETTDFVISVTPFGNYEADCYDYTKLSELLSITRPEQLCTFTQTFANESPVDLISNLSAEGNEYIFYAIWKNYLSSRQLSNDRANEYDQRYQLIISDFLDATKEFFDTRICSSLEYNEFYDNNVYVINLLKDQQERFAQDFEVCYPGHVYNGYQTDDYAFALEDVFREFATKTWYFIVWIALIYIIGSVIILSLTPTRLLL